MAIIKTIFKDGTTVETDISDEKQIVPILDRMLYQKLADQTMSFGNENELLLEKKSSDLKSITINF